MSILRDLWTKAKKRAEPATKELKFRDDFGPALADFEVAYTKADKLLIELSKEAEAMLKLAKKLEATGNRYTEILTKAADTASPDDRQRLLGLASHVPAILIEAHHRSHNEGQLAHVCSLFDKTDKLLH